METMKKQLIQTARKIRTGYNLTARKKALCERRMVWRTRRKSRTAKMPVWAWEVVNAPSSHLHL